MAIAVKTDGTNVHIQVTGRFDFNLHQEFREAYESHGTPNSRFVIDLGATEYLDSSALGMLLVMREYAGGVSSNIVIVNSAPKIRRLFEVANYQRLFEISEAVT